MVWGEIFSGGADAAAAVKSRARVGVAAFCCVSIKARLCGINRVDLYFHLKRNLSTYMRVGGRVLLVGGLNCEVFVMENTEILTMITRISTAAVVLNNVVLWFRKPDASFQL